jgi:hypothetical protein
VVETQQFEDDEGLGGYTDESDLAPVGADALVEGNHGPHARAVDQLEVREIDRDRAPPSFDNRVQYGSKRGTGQSIQLSANVQYGRLTFLNEKMIHDCTYTSSACVVPCDAVRADERDAREAHEASQAPVVHVRACVAHIDGRLEIQERAAVP